MKNNLLLFSGIIILSLFFLNSCQKWDDYKKYQQNGEDIYPGKGDTAYVFSGKNRVQVNWKLGTDPFLTDYKLYWNNRQDSLSGLISENMAGKLLPIIVENMDEGVYNFELVSLNKAGNRSIATHFAGRVYGETYEQLLLNRAYSTDFKYDGQILSIDWNTPDTVNLITEVKYINNNNEEKILLLKPDSSTLVLPNWKTGTKVAFKSAYKPNGNAIDTFWVKAYDSIAPVEFPVDKAAWQAVVLPTDVKTDAYSTAMHYIWDGALGGYPNIYHSADGTMPQHFTFDLGRVYEGLSSFESAGRQDCPCHNPDKLEVWGIADTTNAITTLASNDPGWAAQSVSKGWTLLTTVERNDNGIAPYKVDITPGKPPVRFIRIRILHVIDDHASESHLSEVSFWIKP